MCLQMLAIIIKVLVSANAGIKLIKTINEAKKWTNQCFTAKSQIALWKV